MNWKKGLLLIAVSVSAVLIWRNNISDSPDYIFDKYFEPYQAPTNLRGADIVEMDENMMLGLVKYEEGAYQEAIRLFELASSEDAENYTAVFLTAVSYMQVRKFSSAEVIFKELINDQNHLFLDQSRWYLGLLYLTDEDKTNDKKSATIWGAIQNQKLIEKIRELQ